MIKEKQNTINGATEFLKGRKMVYNTFESKIFLSLNKIREIKTTAPLE